METIKHQHTKHASNNAHEVNIHHIHSGSRTQIHTSTSQSGKTFLKLALSATFHCLIGCGIGEVAGMIISTIMGLNNITSILISIILGLIGGLLLGIRPLLKSGFAFNIALKTVVVGEGLSIVVMESFELLTQTTMPGVMSAHLNEPVFWTGMFVSLSAGFIAALPVNYFMIKRGFRHTH